MSTTQTPLEVTENATQSTQIDLSKTQLLGLFGGGDGPRAMLRAPDGTIITAKADEQTELGEIIAITDAYVLLRDGRTIHRLTIPT